MVPKKMLQLLISSVMFVRVPGYRSDQDVSGPSAEKIFIECCEGGGEGD